MNNTKNISLESTNVRLTGNVKLVIDSEQSLFLESINSSSSLSSIMFKGFQYNEEISYAANVKNFIDMNYISNDEMYAVKSDNSQLINANFNTAISKLYKYGCYSEASQLINENLRFFAPIYINDKKNLPTNFLIIKHSTEQINETSFRTTSDIIDLLRDGKLIHNFDLKKLNRIFKRSEKSYTYINFDDDENDDSVNMFGIDYTTGLTGLRQYTGFSDLINSETTISEFNNTITNFFGQVNLIFSDIYNIEFAFTDEISDGFSNYTGIYVTAEELATIEELIEHTYPTKFIGTTELRPLTNETSLGYYNKFLSASTGIEIGINQYQELSIKMNINPEPYDRFAIFVNGRIDYELIILPELIDKKIRTTLDNICDEINVNYTGEESTIEASYDNKNNLILRSKNLSNDVISFGTSSNSIEVDNVIFSINNNDKYRFKGSNAKTFISRTLSENARMIRFENQDYIIETIYKFGKLFYYEVDRKIEISLTGSSNKKIEYYDILPEMAIICHPIPHAKLDTSIEDEENFNVLDFDKDAFKLFLLKTVYDENYVGAAEAYFGHSDLTPLEIEEYKLIIVDKINMYFNTISYAKNYLINDINIMDMSSSDVVLHNSFERLKENDLLELRRTNRLHSFIQKWRLDEAVDSYFNPYSLNISLAMRSDNFCSSIMNQFRDIREHTMHWFIIGSGRPPYFTKEFNKFNDQLSYTSRLFDVADIESTTIDFYEDQLTYSSKISENSSVYQFHSSWSTIRYDSLHETSFTVFKGVKYKIDDETLDGFRFAIILKTNEIRETTNGFDIEYIRNDVFKTFTVIVYFYIPEPILTSVEGGIEYFVDRSLLYFSNEIYSSMPSQINFGISNISLDLFNKTIEKTYNGFSKTYEWLIFNDDLGEYMMYVHRGNLGRFKTSFKEILEIGGSLTCDYTQSDDMDSPYFGLKVVFDNIVEITKDGFWCTIATAFTVETEDLDGIDDKFIDDNIVNNQITIDLIAMLVSNQDLINSVNLLYYTKFIAYELFTYNKIVSSSANNIRYQSITLANFATTLNLKLINNPLNFSVIMADGFHAAISLEAIKNGNSAELKQLTNKYFYPMYRYEGKYVPTLKTIYDFRIDENVKPQTINASTIKDYRKFSTILNNDYTTNRLIETYDKSILCDTLTNHKYLISTQDNKEKYLELPWLAFTSERRNLSSVVFNSEETLVDFLVNTNEIQFVDICKFKTTKWLNLLQSKLEENELSIKEFYSHSTGSTIDMQTIYNKSIEWFIKNVFLEIYRIDKIQDQNGTTYEYMIENESIHIFGPFDNDYSITYIR